jgi:3-dehydroquinate synthetase
MCQAFRYSAAQGLCAPADAERAAAHFAAVGLPTRVGDIPGGAPDVESLMRLMAQDKKVRSGKLTFILARGIGKAFVAYDVAPEPVKAFLSAEIGASAAR